MQDNPPRWYREDFPRPIHYQDEGAHFLYQLVYRAIPDLR